MNETWKNTFDQIHAEQELRLLEGHVGVSAELAEPGMSPTCAVLPLLPSSACFSALQAYAISFLLL